MRCVTGADGMDPELLAWAPKPREQATRLAADDLRLPGYSDFRLVAEGGEGTVYRARQDGLGRPRPVVGRTSTGDRRQEAMCAVHPR